MNHLQRIDAWLDGDDTLAAALAQDCHHAPEACGTFAARCLFDARLHQACQLAATKHVAQQPLRFAWPSLAAASLVAALLLCVWPTNPLPNSTRVALLAPTRTITVQFSPHKEQLQTLRYAQLPDQRDQRIRL